MGRGYPWRNEAMRKILGCKHGNCTNPAEVGKRLCKKCRERASLASSKFAKKKLAEGLCSKCFRVPPREGRTLCARCSDEYNQKNRARYYRRMEAGLCTTCGGGLDSAAKDCARCRERRKIRNTLRQ